MSKAKILNNVELGGTYEYPSGLRFSLIREDFSLNRKAFEIEFEKTHTRKIYSKTEIEFGRCIDYNIPTVCNIGIVSEYLINKFPSCLIKQKFYKVWHDILNRCYNKKDKDYIFYGNRDIQIYTEWLNLRNFYDWWVKQDYKEGYELDKDLIALANHKEENKIYSPNTCLLIPSRLNQFFISYKNKNSNIIKRASGYQAFVHFKDKMIRSAFDLTYEEALKEKKRMKRDCFLKLNKELNLDKEIYNLCLKVFE